MGHLLTERHAVSHPGGDGCLVSGAGGTDGLAPSLRGDATADPVDLACVGGPERATGDPRAQGTRRPARRPWAQHRGEDTELVALSA
jgi:hypothetical protein